MAFTAQNLVDEAYDLADAISVQVDPSGSPFPVAVRKINLVLREVQNLTGGVEPAATTGIGGLVSLTPVDGTREYDLDALITASLGSGRPFRGVRTVYFLPQGSTVPYVLEKVDATAETVWATESGHPVAYYLIPVTGLAAGTTRIGLLPTPNDVAATGLVKIRLQTYVQIAALSDQIFLHDALFDPIRFFLASEFALTLKDEQRYANFRGVGMEKLKLAMGTVRDTRGPVVMNSRAGGRWRGSTPFPFGKRGYPGGI